MRLRSAAFLPIAAALTGCQDIVGPVAAAIDASPAAASHGGHGLTVTLNASYFLRPFDVGATFQFVALVTAPSGRELGSIPVKWTTSNPTVATVSSTGLMTAVGPGSAIITAKAANASASAFPVVIDSIRDSDGDGVPDSEDTCPLDPLCQ